MTAARRHAETALARMDAILDRAREYCSGQWENWYRDCRKINLRSLRKSTATIVERFQIATDG